MSLELLYHVQQCLSVWFASISFSFCFVLVGVIMLAHKLFDQDKKANAN